MVNEKETPTLEGLCRPSQMCESVRMKETDEGIQKFEIPALFLHGNRKLADCAKTAKNTGQTIRPLVSEKAQTNRRKHTRTGVASSNHGKHSTKSILNDCSMAPAPASSLQAPATWARENRITASARRSATARPTFRCRTARP
jgi:hypothetical protein